MERFDLAAADARVAAARAKERALEAQDRRAARDFAEARRAVLREARHEFYRDRLLASVAPAARPPAALTAPTPAAMTWRQAVEAEMTAGRTRAEAIQAALGSEVPA